MKRVMVASVHHKERKHPSELQQLTREQRPGLPLALWYPLSEAVHVSLRGFSSNHFSRRAQGL